ncbi:F-box domain-containing protein [Strongyloides ratti]|uniref:F-box domain-containing protein n=1 Tax=Strongyloides ratti TaxID=34506 RepID=A0A090MUL3_STRRB|nr:F-box domain-containing protein [Strongyloides ratti]CEF62283.1 F-box domain-containing protein [Strongyloides ratti]
MKCKKLTTKSNNISLTSFPNEILFIIFINLDWKSLEILKRTSKIFYTIIEDVYLPRKKIDELEISSNYHSFDNSWKISVKIKSNNHQIKIINIPFDVKKKDVKIFPIENVLEKYCLRKIGKIEIHIIDDSVVFDLLNRYFQHGTEVKYLKILIEKSSIFKSFCKFIKKIKYVQHLNIEGLCFNNQMIFSNFIFSIERDLKKLIINECKCCHFVNRKMIEQLFKKNPSIRIVKVNTNANDIDKLIINCFQNRPDTKDNGKCNHPTFKLYLPFDEERIVRTEFNRLFSSSSYTYQDYKDNNTYNTSSFGALKTCSNGCHQKAIVVDYSENFYNQSTEDDMSLYEHFILDNIFEIFLVFIICFIVLILFFIVFIIRFIMAF